MRARSDTYHLEELVHLPEDRKLLAGLENLLVLGCVRPLGERIELILLRNISAIHEYILWQNRYGRTMAARTCFAVTFLGKKP